ncbi:hypothetical protein HK405_013785 [Cladochytrium tenue]|nr:hypothetical protein HK405_013785 [Cladochytrium tenue]
MCCPSVEEFRDGEAFGVTAEALKFMADGWKGLKSLEINTEFTDLQAFASVITLFGKRLKRLSITHFRDALLFAPSATLSTEPAASPVHIFSRALSRLSELEVLAIDLSTTPHRDGLTEAALVEILDNCPRLRGLEYFAPIEAYFESEMDNETDGLSMTGSYWEQRRTDITSITKIRKNLFAPSDTASDKLSRRTSLDSASFVKLAGSLSVQPRDDDEDDITSMAPAIPSPIAANEPKLELYGSWDSSDGLTIRKRAAKILKLEDESDFFSGKCDEFFSQLERFAAICTERHIGLNLAWSI